MTICAGLNASCFTAASCSERSMVESRNRASQIWAFFSASSILRLVLLLQLLLLQGQLLLFRAQLTGDGVQVLLERLTLLLGQALALGQFVELRSIFCNWTWCLRRSSARNRFRSSWVNASCRLRQRHPRRAGSCPPRSGTRLAPAPAAAPSPAPPSPSKQRHPRTRQIQRSEHANIPYARMEQITDSPPIRFSAASDPAKVPVKGSQDTRLAHS